MDQLHAWQILTRYAQRHGRKFVIFLAGAEDEQPTVTVPLRG